jgi:hypothetical protein
MNKKTMKCNVPRREVQGGKKFVVYETTNMVNGRTYLGVTKRNSINSGYIGCGVVSQKSAETRAQRVRGGFCAAVAKYGYDNFTVKVLADFDCEADAYLLEAELVNEAYVLSPNTYNLCLGGSISKPMLKVWGNRHEIIERYKNGETLSSIAKDFNVKHKTIKAVIPSNVFIRPRNQWILNGGKNIKIMCKETGEVFESITAAALKFFGRKSGSSSINQQISGIYKTAAGHTFCRV